MDVKINQEVLEKVFRAERDALQDTAQYVLQLLREKVKKEAFDTWEFEKSLFVKVIWNWNVIQIWSRTAQAVIMEFGRRPLQKRPPMDSLVWWASRHGMIAGWVKSYANLKSKDKWTVYLLATSIAKKGIKPREIFRKLYNETIDQINAYFISSLQKRLWSQSLPNQ